jgi:hypothetical protein
METLFDGWPIYQASLVAFVTIGAAWRASKVIFLEGLNSRPRDAVMGRTGR